MLFLVKKLLYYGVELQQLNMYTYWPSFNRVQFGAYILIPTALEITKANLSFLVLQTMFVLIL